MGYQVRRLFESEEWRRQCGVQRSGQPLSETELVRLVRDYVAWRDQLARKREFADYPENPAQRAEMMIEAEFETQTFVLNLTTAKALGLTIPAAFLSLADDLIE